MLLSTLIIVCVSGAPPTTLDIEEYVKGCLAAEMNPRWHEEALKAQSKLIRTYGLARMAERGWVYADERDQVWDSSKRTTRTDAIVETTRGMVGTYNGKIVPTYYSSACGGTTTDLDWHGNTVPYLRAVECSCGMEQNGHRRGMCQYGAKALAEQGKTCDQILDFYYQGMEWVGNYGRRTTDMPSKLFYQFQDPNIPGWAKNHVKESGVNIVKRLQPDFGEANPIPWVEWHINRYVWDKDADKALISQGSAGAEVYFWEWLWPRLQSCGTPRAKTIVEGPNEPPVQTPEQVHNLANFERRRIELVHSRGFLTGSPDVGTGNPPGTVENIQNFWRILGPAIAHADVVITHEYGMRSMANLGWPHLGRSRIGLDILWNELGIKLPLIITETGIDYQGQAEEDGWRQHTSGIRDYIDNHLAPYDEFLGLDPRIFGACPFIWLHQGWPSFDIPEADSWQITQYIKAKGAFQVALGSGAPWPEPTPVDPRITEGEMVVAREHFSRVTPATVKDAYRHGDLWYGELPDQGDNYYRYLARDPAYVRDKLVKQDKRTLERVDERPL